MIVTFEVEHAVDKKEVEVLGSGLSMQLGVTHYLR